MSETEYTKGYRAGRAYEQDRIIKLLEIWLSDDDGDFGDTLKLIKGEK
jgi:hypothetical protein